MADKKFIKDAIKRPGAFKAKAESRGMTTEEFRKRVLANPGNYDARTVRQAQLAKTLGKLRAQSGVDPYSALPTSSNTMTSPILDPQEAAEQTAEIQKQQQQVVQNRAEAEAERERLNNAAADATIRSGMQDLQGAGGDKVRTSIQAGRAARDASITQAYGTDDLASLGVDASARIAGKIAQGTATSAQVAKASGDTGALLTNLGAYGQGAGAAADAGQAAAGVSSSAIAGPAAIASIGGKIIEGTAATSRGEDAAAEYSFQEGLGSGLKAAGTGAGTGAMIGSIFGPVGTLVGGAAGALVGLGVEAFRDVREVRRGRRERAGRQFREGMEDRRLSRAATDVRNQSYMVSGSNRGYNPNYLGNIEEGITYMHGGMKVPGGKVMPMRDGGKQYIGRKHSKGGIDLGDVEVEGGETSRPIMNSQGKTVDYIFSEFQKLKPEYAEQLGVKEGSSYADVHKMMERGAIAKDYRGLAKMQEQHMKEKGKTETGPRGPELIAQNALSPMMTTAVTEPALNTPLTVPTVADPTMLFNQQFPAGMPFAAQAGPRAVEQPEMPELNRPVMTRQGMPLSTMIAMGGKAPEPKAPIGPTMPEEYVRLQGIQEIPLKEEEDIPLDFEQFSDTYPNMDNKEQAYANYVNAMEEQGKTRKKKEKKTKTKKEKDTADTKNFEAGPEAALQLIPPLAGVFTSMRQRDRAAGLEAKGTPTVARTRRIRPRLINRNADRAAARENQLNTNAAIEASGLSADQKRVLRARSTNQFNQANAKISAAEDNANQQIIARADQLNQRADQVDAQLNLRNATQQQMLNLRNKLIKNQALTNADEQLLASLDAGFGRFAGAVGDKRQYDATKLMADAVASGTENASGLNALERYLVSQGMMTQEQIDEAKENKAKSGGYIRRSNKIRRKKKK
tara:strand:+ start:6787 stop:9507 length:2721 start_codon:yes stop_codon:yes gene_type:complete